MRKKLSRFSRILANSRKFDAEKYYMFENCCFQFVKMNSHFFRPMIFFAAKNSVSLHLIFLLQLNRESLFSRKMTKAVIRES